MWVTRKVPPRGPVAKLDARYPPTDKMSLMLATAIVLFVISLVAEGAAVYLLVREARAASTTLREWQGANPQNNDGGSWAQILQLNGVVTGLLGAPRTRFLAVVLIGVGLVAGSAGNFAALAL